MKIHFTISFLLISTVVALAHTPISLVGQWTNIKDTTEHLTILENGGFLMTVHNQFSNEYKKVEGTWLYKSTRKQKFFLFYNNRQKQFFVVRKRGKLGYTLNDLKRKIVFSQKLLKEGESLPKIESAVN